MVDVGSAVLRGEASTRVFRALLRSLAEPGAVVDLPAGAIPAGVAPALVVPLALADLDSTVAIVGEDPDGPVARLLATATDARWAPVEAASFVVDDTADPWVPGRSRRGSALEPERGARLSVSVRGFGGHRGTAAWLRGPGVPGSRLLRVDGVRPAWFDALGDTNDGRPAGVDVWLVSDDARVVGIPRSTRITLVDEDLVQLTAVDEER